MPFKLSFLWSALDATPPESRGVGKPSPTSTLSLSTQLRTQPNTPTTPGIPIPSPTISPQQDPFIVGDYLVHPGKPLDGIKLKDYFAETYKAKASKRFGKDDEPKICTLKKIPLATAVQKKACEDEIQVLSELAEGRHPTTFHLLDYTILEQPDENGHRWDIFYLFSDLEIGNLSRMLAEHRRDGTMIAEGDVIRIAIDLVDALTFLHGCQPPLLHRNIRPSSVIQTSSGVFKFSSFLSAGFRKASNLLADHLVAEDLECYTDPRYHSPEMIGEETQLGRSPGECTAESGAIYGVLASCFTSCVTNDIHLNQVAVETFWKPAYPNAVIAPGPCTQGSNPSSASVLYQHRELQISPQPADLIFVRDPKARPTAKLLRAALRHVLQIRLPPDNVPPINFSETTINLLNIPRQSYKRTDLVRQGSSSRNPHELRVPFWSPDDQSIMERKGSTSSRNRASSNKQRKDGGYYNNVPLLSPPPPSSHHRSKSESRHPTVKFNSVKRSDDKDGSGNVPTIFIEGAGGEPPSGSLSQSTAVPPRPSHPYPSLSVPPSPIRSSRHTRSHSDGAHPPPDHAFAALRVAQNSKKNDSAYLSADRSPSTQISRPVELPLTSASLDCTKPDTRIDSDDIQDQPGQSNGALRLETGLIGEGKALPPIPPDESPDIPGPEQAAQAETSSPTDDIGLYVTIKSLDPICTIGHFGDILEGVHKTVGKVALKRPRMGTTDDDEKDTIRLCETADAIDYLHKKEIVHGDIKASNILVNDDTHVQLCDFGLTKVLHSRTSTMMKGAGTVRWQSPELWENAPRTLESDVYAFAMTIAEVITGDFPFPDIKNEIAIVLAVREEDKRPEMDPKEFNGVSYENVWNVAEACWKKEPGARISISEAFSRLQADPSLL
ncbi:hypothetical protein FRC04_002357 [Tulasnella sp. 424]|nr:hypothetical protein FRC04_002357 [Tulasnella sp. 424]